MKFLPAFTSEDLIERKEHRAILFNLKQWTFEVCDMKWTVLIWRAATSDLVAQWEFSNWSHTNFVYLPNSTNNSVQLNTTKQCTNWIYIDINSTFSCVFNFHHSIEPPKLFFNWMQILLGQIFFNAHCKCAAGPVWWQQRNYNMITCKLQAKIQRNN